MAEREILGNFFVIEGLDGAGTTTQTRLLSRHFRSTGRRTFMTYEPTDGTIGRFIRRVLHNQEKVDVRTLAFLFACDRNEHLNNPENGLLAHIAAGELVLCDRYLFSSLAYQSLDCDFDFIFAINQYFPLPERLLLIDTPIDICQQRIARRRNIELFDDREMQEKILGNYRKIIDLFRPSDMEITLIDGGKSIEEIHADILQRII